MDWMDLIGTDIACETTECLSGEDEVEIRVIRAEIEASWAGKVQARSVRYTGDVGTGLATVPTLL